MPNKKCEAIKQILIYRSQVKLFTLFQAFVKLFDPFIGRLPVTIFKSLSKSGIKNEPAILIPLTVLGNRTN